MLELVQAIASYSSNSNDRMWVSECENTSKSNVVYKWYHITNIITDTDLVGIIVLPITDIPILITIPILILVHL